jgi:hypothetical protein
MSEATDDEKLVIEAHARFDQCEDFEGDFRKLFTDDLKFVSADSDNGYQWPDAMRLQRQSNAKPCLTINKTRQHALMVINEAKENRPSVKVNAVGGDASYESAQVYEGVIRHIEYQSNATDAYDTALDFQVKTGIGYWRVVTEYAGDDSFDQELFIRRIRNPLSVYLDPDIKEMDGSDAKFGFIFDDMRREDFDRKYPTFKDQVATSVFGQSSNWCTKDTVRVAEYYYVDYEKDTLIALPMPQQNPDGTVGEVLEMIALSALRESMPDLAKVAMKDKTIQKRPIQRQKVLWCLIAGDQIIDRSEWVGSTIPIVRVVGEECMIDGKLDRKGHVRNLKDPQRMYNYWSSSATEHVALQTKTPYVAGARSIEGFEPYWENANTENSAYLPYNDVDDQGNPLLPPQRAEAPVMSQAYMSGMQVAAEEMKMVSGQNDALMGAPSNEISGIAIGKRSKQGVQSTMQYRDNQAKAIRYTGKILIEAIPRVYDTPRTIRILAEDGSDDTVQIDPTQEQPMVESKKQDGTDGVNRAFNPAMGKYEVIADTGPNYSSKREEAFDAMTSIAMADPTFLQKAGDLYFKAGDFAMADELSERYKNSIPAEIRGEAPPPEQQMLQEQLDQAGQQIQQLQAQLAAAMQTAADFDKKAENKDKETEINAFKATTDRLKALIDKMDPAQAALLAAQAVSQSLADPMPVDQQALPEMQQIPPMQDEFMQQPSGIPPLQ